MGVRKNKKFQSCHLTLYVAYTELNLIIKGIWDMEEQKEILKQMAKSGEAARLMELLNQKGSVQQAAQAAAKGDVSQLKGMIEQLMNTKDGSELIERINRKAKEAGLS